MEKRNQATSANNSSHDANLKTYSLEFSNGIKIPTQEMITRLEALVSSYHEEFKRTTELFEASRQRYLRSKEKLNNAKALAYFSGKEVQHA